MYLHAWRIAPRFDPARGSALALLVSGACRTLAEFGHRSPLAVIR